MALSVPHQSRGLPETGGGVRLRQTAPASRRDSPAPFTTPAVGNNQSKRDSQVLQRVQARERLLGHRADLIPLQEPGKKPTGQPDQVQPWWAGRHAAAVGNLQPLQLLQGRERPIHVLDGPGDLVLLEVPFDRNKETTLLKRSCKQLQT